MKKVIVTGSRTFPTCRAVFKVLEDIFPDLVIHGGAHGADSFAEQWAKFADRDTHVFRPRWRTSAGYVRSAGHVRNGRMLEAYPGVPVIAFPYGAAKGTRNCIEQARARGHEVTVYDEDGVELISSDIP